MFLRLLQMKVNKWVVEFAVHQKFNDFSQLRLLTYMNLPCK